MLDVETTWNQPIFYTKPTVFLMVQGHCTPNFPYFHHFREKWFSKSIYKSLYKVVIAQGAVPHRGCPMVGALSDEHPPSLCSETKYSVSSPSSLRVEGNVWTYIVFSFFIFTFLYWSIHLWDVVVYLQGLILSGHPSGLWSWQFWS